VHSAQTIAATKAAPAARVDLARAGKDALFTALLGLGLFLPLIGFKTVTNIRNELILETRFGLLAIFVALMTAASLVNSFVVAPWRARRAVRERAPAKQATGAFAKYFAPFALGFVLIYPALVLGLAGSTGATKWIDNFGIQILIYVMLGFGLNIVVGLAGLLAACWGVMLGFPVLRLRGDYLAIVTLAFGEIIRLVLINWVPVTNGYAGISGVPRPSFFGIPFNASDEGFAATFGLPFSPIYRTIFLYYLILALVLLTAFVVLRLRRLPIGRAWEALREDEIACRSLGINTTTTKLTAFATGALFGGFAGSFFATRQGFISPESFTFMESATVLAIVVLGGMGSQIGVAIAAVIMIGGTEILRDLDFLKDIFGPDFDPTQYRMLLFGLAMVLIMVWKPRGLVATREPSAFLRERKAIGRDLVKEGRG